MDIQAGNPKRVQKALKKGADLNAQDEMGNTPLILATDACEDEIVELLVKAGACDFENKKGHTALSCAVFRNDTKITKLLIKATFNINVRIGCCGTPALSYAAQYGNVEIVEALIKAGAFIDDKCSFGKTALIWAAFHCREQVVDLLIKSGADATIKDNMNKTALGHFNQDEFPEMAALLRDAMKYPQKYKMISEDEKNKIATQVQALSTQEINQLPETDPCLLRKLCVFKGVMEVTFAKLDYLQQKAVYAETYKAVLPEVRQMMENTLRNNNTK